MSETVYKALKATGGEAAQGTAHFVMMFDHFFDCLNVNSFIAGKINRKPFQDPYRSASDFRIEVCIRLRHELCLNFCFNSSMYAIYLHPVQWLEKDFIGYLDRWEQSAQEVAQSMKLSKSEKNNMLLAPETRLGLRTTGDNNNTSQLYS